MIKPSHRSTTWLRKFWQRKQKKKNGLSVCLCFISGSIFFSEAWLVKSVAREQQAPQQKVRNIKTEDEGGTRKDYSQILLINGVVNEDCVDVRLRNDSDYRRSFWFKGHIFPKVPIILIVFF